MKDGGRLDFHVENLLVEPFIHPLKHRVVVGILAVNREILLNAADTLNRHVLGDFHCIRAPRGNHLTSGTNKTTGQRIGFLKRRLSVEPAQLGFFLVTDRMVDTRRNHTL